MRKLLAILTTLICVGAAAQVRSYSDNASKTFIVGLESYFYGENGTLDFTASQQSFKASLNQGVVSVNGSVLESGAPDTVVGIHDFTEDRSPELVVARRTSDSVSANIYTFSGGAWKKIGRIGSKEASEIRVFRQVMSIRRGGVLCSWTWHSDKFDYKASDGSAEPVL